MPKRLFLLVLVATGIGLVGWSLPASAHEEVSPSTFPVGRPTFLTVSVANERSVDLTRVTLTAPAGLPFGEGTRQPPGWAATATEEAVTWSGGKVAPHAFEQWGFEIEGADQPGPVRYKVTIGFADGSTEAAEVEVTAVAAGSASTPTTVSAGTVPASTAPSVTPTPPTPADESDDGGGGPALTFSLVALVLSIVAMGLARRRPASPSVAGGAEAPKSPGQDW
ncbi:MAG: hypothetical protein ACRD0Q_11815 [Acidimicrobiales bacterium]